MNGFKWLTQNKKLKELNDHSFQFLQFEMNKLGNSFNPFNQKVGKKFQPIQSKS